MGPGGGEVPVEGGTYLPPCCCRPASRRLEPRGHTKSSKIGISQAGEKRRGVRTKKDKAAGVREGKAGARRNCLGMIVLLLHRSVNSTLVTFLGFR